MKKWLKRVAITLGVLFVLALAGLTYGFFYLKKHYPPEKVKAMVEQKAEEKLHRKLQIGDANLTLAQGLVLENISLAERSGWGEGPFLSVGKVQIKPELLPLLWFSVQLEARVLDPRAKMVTRGRKVKRGTGFVTLPENNYDDLTQLGSPSKDSSSKTDGNPALSKQSASKGEGGPAALPLTGLEVVALEIRNGVVSMRDESVSPASEILLPDLDVLLKHMSLTGGRPTEFTLSCPSQMAGMTFPFSLAGHFLISMRDDQIRNLKAKGDFCGLGLDAQGGMDKLTSNLAMDLGISGKGKIEDVLKPLGALPLQIKGPLAADLAIKGGLSKLNISGSVDMAGVSLENPGVFVKKAGVPLALSYTFVYSPSVWPFKFKGQFASAEISGNGALSEVERLDRPLSLALKTNDIALSDLMALCPLAAGVQTNGTLRFDLDRLSMNMGRMDTLKMSGKFGTKKLGIGTKDFPGLLSAFTGAASFTEKTASLAFQFKLTGHPGSWTAAATGKNWMESDPEKLALKLNSRLNAEVFDIEAFKALFPPIVHLKDALRMAWASFKAAKPKSAEQKQAPTGPRLADTLDSPMRLVPGSWVIKSTNSLKSLKFRELAATDINFDLSFANRKAEITKSGFHIAGGGLSAVAAMDMAKKGWDDVTFRSAMTLSQVTIEKFMTDALKAARAKNPEAWGQMIQGAATGKMTLAYYGIDPDRILKTLTGDVALDFPRGGFALPADILGYVSKVGVKKLPAGQMEKIRFRGNIKDEKLNITTLDSAGTDLRIARGEGAVDFEARYADHLDLVLEFGPKVLDCGDLSGQGAQVCQLGQNPTTHMLPLTFRFAGPISAPKVEAQHLMDEALKNVAKNAAQKVVQSGTKQLQQKVLPKAGDALKKLFKR